MSRTLRRILAPVTIIAAMATLATAAPREDPPAKAKQHSLQVQGRVVRTAPDQIVVQTNDKRKVIVHTRPLTRFVLNERPIRLAEVQVGATVTAVYDVEDNRFLANTVTVVSGPGEIVETANLLQGQIVRVIAPDQVVMQAIDGTEVTFFVDPTTAFLIAGQTGRFTDLRTGLPIAVAFDVRDQRKIARRITTFTSVNGQVVRVVGQDQVIVRGPDGREVAMFVSPETRFRLTPQGGAFTDLRPGSNVTVFFNTRDQRNMAQHVFVPHTTPRR